MSCWRGDDLGHRRLEAVEDHRGDVELARLEHLHDALRDLLGIAEAEPRAAEIGDGLDDVAGEVAAQLVAALAADRQDLDRLALGQQRTDGAARLAHDRAVEAAAQAAVGGGDDQQMDLVGAGAGQQPGPGAALEAGAQRRHDVVHGLGIGAGRHGLLLGAPQLGRGHHLHGLGDLLRRLDASDPEPEGFETGHRKPGDRLGELLDEVGRGTPSACRRSP